MPYKIESTHYTQIFIDFHSLNWFSKADKVFNEPSGNVFMSKPIQFTSKHIVANVRDYIIQGILSPILWD